MFKIQNISTTRATAVLYGHVLCLYKIIFFKLASPSKADSYAYEKLIRKWTKSVPFGFLKSYGYENGPDSYGQIRLSFS